jgi:hypothetical protein
MRRVVGLTACLVAVVAILTFGVRRDPALADGLTAGGSSPVVVGNVTSTIAGQPLAVAMTSTIVSGAVNATVTSTTLTGVTPVAMTSTTLSAATPNATASGTISGTSTLSVATPGAGALRYAVTGTWSGTILSECSIDGTNFYSCNADPLPRAGKPSTPTLTSSGQWETRASGLQAFRLRAATVTGTASVWITVGTTSDLTFAHVTDDGVVLFQTSTSLGANASITTGAMEMLGYSSYEAIIYASASSSVNGVLVEQSVDGVTFYTDHTSSYLSSYGIEHHNHSRGARYTRITYTNGPAPAATFVFQIIGLAVALTRSTDHMTQAIHDDDTAALGRSVIVGRTPAGSQTTTYSNVNADVAGSLMMHDQGPPGPSYSAASSTALAATPTDFCYLVGSATKIVRITSLRADGYQSTGGNEGIALVKRSSANTGGTCTAVPAVALDSLYAGTTTPAATAIMYICSANPTLGTAIGTVDVTQFYLAAKNSANATPYTVEWEDGTSRSPALHGTNEIFAINLLGVTKAGGNLDCNFVWSEENP